MNPLKMFKYLLGSSRKFEVLRPIFGNGGRSDTTEEPPLWLDGLREARYDSPLGLLGCDEPPNSVDNVLQSAASDVKSDVDLRARGGGNGNLQTK